MKQVKWEVTKTGCWECISHAIVKGYPYQFRNGKFRSIARMWYEDLHGKIPKGMVVRHTCDNPLCINLRHLELGTVKDNVHDRKRHGTYGNGENNSLVKLTWQQIDEIRQSKKSGYMLAKEYGVSHSEIYNIINLKCWTEDGYGKAKYDPEKGEWR